MQKYCLVIQLIYRRDRQDGRRGGGVLVCVKAGLHSIRRHNLEGPNTEHIMVELFPLNSSKFMLGVFYRPPDSDLDTLTELRDMLDKLQESCKLLLVGDFNLPYIDWSLDFPSPTQNNGHKEETFCGIISDNFLQQAANGPTHISGNKLDLIFSNQPELLTNVTCTHPANIFPTDHCLIDFDIQLSFLKAKPVQRIVYVFKNADFSGLCEHLARVPLSMCISDESDMNECWQKWKDLFITAVEEHVPKKINQR